MAKRSPFAENTTTGELFVRLDHTGIHPLVVMCDGLPIAIFKGIKKPYLTVQQAIEWHHKELSETKGQSGNRKIMDALITVLAVHHAETATV